MLGVAVLAFAWGHKLEGIFVGGVAALLAACVLAAVHHAEVVAHRVGEPYGSLVLAVAVTVIEVALIVSWLRHTIVPVAPRCCNPLCTSLCLELFFF